MEINLEAKDEGEENKTVVGNYSGLIKIQI